MREIDLEELHQLKAKHPEAVLLDCRGADYYHWERIPGSQNLRWKLMESQASKRFPAKDTMIITYCQSFLCTASVKGYELLERMGYTNLFEYSGGIEDWRARGNGTESSPQFKLAPHIYRFPEQEFYGEQVGSYLIETEQFLLLIDGPMQLTEAHEDFILSFGKPIKILLTHGATAGETALLQKKHGAKIYLHQDDANNPWLTLKPDVLFSRSDILGPGLQVLHTPGHSAGSICLYHEASNLLFTGDTLAGTKQGEIRPLTPDSHDEDSKQRKRSVRNLLEIGFAEIHPFHYGAVRTSARDKLKDYLFKEK